MQHEQASTNKSQMATFAGLLACLVWSSAVFLMNKLAVAFGPIPAAGYELILAGGFLLLVSWQQGNIPKIALHSRRSKLICGSFWLLNVTFMWLAMAAVNNSGELIVVGLLNYLWPSLTLLLAVPILKKRTTYWLVPGMAAVLLGILMAKVSTSSEVALAQVASSFNFIAYILGILCALTWALYSNLSRKLSNPLGASAVPYYMIVGGIALTIVSFFIEKPNSATLADWLLLAAWAISSGLTYLGWDVGMRKGNVVAISTTSMLIPLISTIITAANSGFGISMPLICAALLVVVGSAICRKGVVDTKKTN